MRLGAMVSLMVSSFVKEHATQHNPLWKPTGGSKSRRKTKVSFCQFKKKDARLPDSSLLKTDQRIQFNRFIVFRSDFH